jgi:DNA-binding response OmpR family regulator
MKILLLEDDQILGETIEIFLTQENYTVLWVTTIEEAEEVTFNDHFDLYLFDTNLPEGTGLSLLQDLRYAEDTTPTIFITALTDMNSMAKGFKLGALDYIKKPFDPEELLIRIGAKFKEENIQYGNIFYSPDTQTIRLEGKVVDIGIVPTKIFAKLIDNVGSVVYKEELLDCLEHPSDNALRVNMTKIKQKLSIEIKNIRSRGYLIEKEN